MSEFHDDGEIVTRALSGDLVMNIGQLSPRAVRALDKLARAGTLVRLRASFCSVSSWKTAWVRADRISEGCTRGYFDSHYFEVNAAFHALEAA